MDVRITYEGNSLILSRLNKFDLYYRFNSIEKKPSISIEVIFSGNTTLALFMGSAHLRPCSDMMGRLRVNRNKAEQTNSNREGRGRRREGVRRSRVRRKMRKRRKKERRGKEKQS